jgi:protein phosphatase
MKMTLTVKSATDQGLRRAQNEDRHAFWFAEDAGRGVLLVVADGMGGARGGEVASQLAVDTVIGNYREANGDGVLDDLAKSVEAANRAVYEQSISVPGLHGMGTTCTALVVRDHEAFVAHVGDSRAYVLHDGSLRQLTQDHSLVAQLIQSRQLTPEQAKSDPRRNLVTRSIGVGSTVAVDAGRVAGKLNHGDTLLLCTDGLHGLVTDLELANIASGPDLERACRDLIALANQRGGPDNITVILARLESDQPARRGR